LEVAVSFPQKENEEQREALIFCRRPDSLFRMPITVMVENLLFKLMRLLGPGSGPNARLRRGTLWAVLYDVIVLSQPCVLRPFWENGLYAGLPYRPYF